MAPKLTNSDKEWQARDDAFVLSQAETIKLDTKRMKAAVSMTKKMVKEKEKEVKSLKKIVKQKPVSKGKTRKTKKK